jgi:hypothetical protein
MTDRGLVHAPTPEQCVYQEADASSPDGRPGSLATVSRRPWLEPKHGDERSDAHADCLSASACSSQNRMSISRYILVAVVRCSRACSRSPVRR